MLWSNCSLFSCSDDSDDDVYDNNEDDEFEAEGHTTQKTRNQTVIL